MQPSSRYNFRPGLFFVLLLCNIFALNVVAAQSGNYQVTVDQTNAELILQFSSPPVYTLRTTEQGLVLSFDKDLGGMDLSSAAGELSSWVLSLWAGYDSFVVKPKQGVDVDFVIQGNRLHVYFSSEAIVDKDSGITETGSVVAVDRVKALLLLESGQLTQARQRFMELSRIAPDNVQLMLDLARAEEALSRWREALSLYEQAQQSRPDSTDIAKARKRLLDAYGSRMNAGVEFIEIGDTSRGKIAKLGIRELLKNWMAISVEYEILDAKEEENIRHVDGELKPFSVVRHELVIELETSLKAGTQRFSLFGGAKKPGLGWAYSQASNYGVTQGEIEWSRPWFETPEAVVGYGFRDRLMVGHSQSFDNRISVYGEFSLNRYGLEDVDTAAESSRVQIGGQYWLKESGDGFFMGYGLDAENVSHHEKRMDSQGNQFAPLPLESKELHVVGIGWSKGFESHLNVNTKLGYEYDRRRESSAPFGHLYLAYKPGRNIEWDVGVQSGLSSYKNEDESYLRVSGNLTWLF